MDVNMNSPLYSNRVLLLAHLDMTCLSEFHKFDFFGGGLNTNMFLYPQVKGKLFRHPELRGDRFLG